MEKLIKCALGTKFKTEQIDAVMEVINGTPNPQVATEILLGIYEEPLFADKHTISNRECKFESFDKWTNQVSHSYVKNKQVYIYIKKGTDKSLINKDNYKDFQVSYKDGDDSCWVTLDELETVHNQCDASNWKSGDSFVEYIG
jgi:hypothetical protein